MVVQWVFQSKDERSQRTASGWMVKAEEAIEYMSHKKFGRKVLNNGSVSSKAEVEDSLHSAHADSECCYPPSHGLRLRFHVEVPYPLVGSNGALSIFGLLELKL